MFMKKIFFVSMFVMFANFLFANNLVISTPIYSDANKTITFIISWDNSWKITTGPSNFDGVWVFIKRQACSSTNIWASALVSTTSSDHTTSITGTNLLTVDAVADGMGVFIRRASSGLGNIAAHTIVLKLNSGLSTKPAITASATDNFKIMGVEMVYVPKGAFYLGDGRSTNTTNFSSGDNASTALLIDEAKQLAGLGGASVYTANAVNGCPNNLPSTFPLGYDGFWCMKYELSAVSYTDFLNCLTYDQQAVRLSKWGTRYPNAINNAFTAGMSYKNDIHIITAGTYNTIPAVFSIATNNWNKYTPTGFISWLDLTAYLDWSGLRPVTEFEYEKLCRGTATPVANEYPWGSTTITQTGRYYPDNPGVFNEISPNTGEGLCKYAQQNDDNYAPWRSGFAATNISTRSQAGATYYGIMEIGGNVWEQVVGGGSGYDFSGFTTANGDGILGTDGNANTTGWPNAFGSNTGNYIKGGGFDWNTTTTMIQISDRTFYAGISYSNGQYSYVGGRGIRSFTY